MPFAVLVVVTDAVFTGLTGSVSEVSTAALSPLLPNAPVKKSAEGTARTTARPAHARPQVTFEFSLMCCNPLTQRPRAKRRL